MRFLWTRNLVLLYSSIEESEEMRVAGRVFNFLKSRRLALWLLIIITIASFLGTLTPQRLFLGEKQYNAWKTKQPVLAKVLEWLGVTHLYSSWWFITLLSLLLVSIFLCVLNRLLHAFRRGQKSVKKKDVAELKLLPNYQIVSLAVRPDMAREIVKRVFIRRKFRVSYQQNACWFVIAEKGRSLNFWGSIVFHLGLLVLSVGVLVSIATRSTGRTVIGIGQKFYDRPQDYLEMRRGLVSPAYSNFQVEIDKVSATYSKKSLPRNIISRVKVIDGGKLAVSTLVDASHPLIYKGTYFYQVGYGYSPFLVLKDEEGREIFSAYVNLLTLTTPNKKQVYKDSFYFLQEMRVNAEFFPDGVVKNKIVQTRSYELRNPILLITVNQGKKKLFKGPLRINQSVKVGGMTLAFTDVVKWVGFHVVKDRGIPIIYSSFVLGVAGLSLAFFTTDKRIWIVLEEEGNNTVVYIGGVSHRYKSNKYKHSFGREFDSIVNEICRL